jgi:hypothetical protein
MTSSESQTPTPSAPHDASEKPARGKEAREWLQLGLNAAAAVAAVFLFFRYDAQNRELTNKLTRLNVQVAALQHDINVVTLERSRVELEGLKGRKIEVTKSLRTTQVKNGYNVDFQYALKNAGTRPVEITNGLAEAYVGRIPTGVVGPAVINAPHEEGPVVWRSVFRRANVSFEKWEKGYYLETADANANPRRVMAARGGGGTGRLNGGESSQDGITLFVPASKHDFIAVLVTITIDEEDGRTFGVVDSIAIPRTIQ